MVRRIGPLYAEALLNTNPIGVPTMRRTVAILLASLALTAATVASAAAHDAGPCGGGSGRAYAEHHVVFNAHEQTLGAHGHAPGEHRGFSTCV